ncbi:hypothetical protein JW868_02765 [Candidatus Woesearchaeota archaeon]|nr:hypothetical protein [Candidatus Woesearchaeota archaeon]
MLAEKPKECFLFPGMEYSTAERIDIVIFSHSAVVYADANLNAFRLTYLKP